MNSSSTESAEIKNLVEEALSPYARLFTWSRIIERFSKYFSFALVFPMFLYIYRMAEVMVVPAFFAMLPAGFVVFILLFFVFRFLEGLFTALGRTAFNNRFPLTGTAERLAAIDVLHSMKANSLGRKIRKSLPEIRAHTYVPQKGYATQVGQVPMEPSAPADSPGQEGGAGTCAPVKEIEFTPPWTFRPKHILLEPEKDGIEEEKKERTGIRKSVLLEPRKARPPRAHRKDRMKGADKKNER